VNPECPKLEGDAPGQHQALGPGFEAVPGSGQACGYAHQKNTKHDVPDQWHDYLQR